MIESVGMNRTVNIGEIKKTAAVGPRLQPEQKPEDEKKLKEQRDTIQNQLTTIKGLSEAPKGGAIGALEEKLGEVNEKLAAVGTKQASALERLRGQTDTYDGGAGVKEQPGVESQEGKTEQTTMNTDDVDKEIKSLEKEQKDLSTEVDAAKERGDSDAWDRLMKQLKSVQAELQQKDTDSYRRQHATIL